MASRRHWRFILRDQYGYVIQNAKVNVFQPGTSNNFTGTAYDAASGGSTVTNPFTTNSQGEVEAWFDNAQPVDVQVDDNTDTAYRAVDGSGAVISFTTFTEKDEIDVSPEDVLTSVILNAGESGDIATTLVNPFTAVTAVAGATGEFADAAHVHPYTALTPAAPVIQRTVGGAGSLTNPARSDHIHQFTAPVGKTSKFTTTSDTNEQLLHSYTIPASTLAAGSMFRVQLRGYQTNSTTACTYTFRIRHGGLAGTQLFSTAFVGTTTTHTDNPHCQDWLITFQSVGAAGSATCSTNGAECITTATANTPKLILDVQAAAVGSLDTTADKDLVVTVQMNTTTGTPNFEVDNVLIEQVA